MKKITLNDFQCPPIDTVITLLKKTNKTCKLDNIPLEVFKGIIMSIAPYTLSFIQESIQQNSIPKSLKKSMTPLLKNNSLEVESLINYRPVYQLTIFHKIFEKILCIQLNEYIINKNILNKM